MRPDENARSFRFRHPVEVRFRDLDPAGHVHHALPVVYFEQARAAYWREVVRPALTATAPPDAAPAAHAGSPAIEYVIGELTVRYHRRILSSATLAVGVRVAGLGGKSFTMEYELRGPDAPADDPTASAGEPSEPGTPTGELLASGRSVQVMYDYAAERSIPIPDDVRRRIEAFEAGGG